MNNESILCMGPVLESLFKWTKLSSILSLCMVNKEMLAKCSEPLYWEQIVKRYIQLQLDAENLCINIKPLFSVIENACCYVSKLAEAFIIASVNLECIDTDPRFFITALENGFKKLFSILVKKWGINLKREDGLTALQLLQIISNPLKNDIVEKLLKAGSDPNTKSTKSTKNYTFLMQCACSGKTKLVELLLRYGADPNIKTETNIAPLHAVSMYGHYEIVELLLKFGADFNEPGMNGHTPLISASFNNCRGRGDAPLVVKLLLEYGADPNKQNNRGETALMYACYRGNYEIVKLLVNRGADPSIQDINGKKAIYIINNNNNIVKQLYIDLLEKAECSFKPSSH